MARPPMSTDFDVQTSQSGNKGHITVRANTKDNGFLNFMTIGGKYVIPSSGDIIDRKTRKIVYTLHDETGVQLQSEKIVEIDFKDGKPERSNDQFGVGQKR